MGEGEGAGKESLRVLGRAATRFDATLTRSLAPLFIILFATSTCARFCLKWLNLSYSEAKLFFLVRSSKKIKINQILMNSPALL